jgi:hypothetical protein
MARRATCESWKCLDVRQVHRRNLLWPGLQFSWDWTRDDEPSGSITILIEPDSVLLSYRIRLYDTTEWKDIRQRIPVTWTSCHFGGKRPWFICDVSSNGKYCGRRVAKLYLAGELFACRHCYGLAYESQQQNPRTRARRRAQKIMMRLGGSGDLADPFPEKPSGMHWRTYQRLYDQADAAETKADDLFCERLLQILPECAPGYRRPVRRRRVRRARRPADLNANRLRAIFDRWRRQRGSGNC